MNSDEYLRDQQAVFHAVGSWETVNSWRQVGKDLRNRVI
jgi:hypothetical protein